MGIVPTNKIIIIEKTTTTFGILCITFCFPALISISISVKSLITYEKARNIEI